MMITTDLVVSFSAGLITVCAVVGLAVKFVLLPYLREHLVNPMAAVKHQVQNDHTSNLRQDMDEIRRLVAAGNDALAAHLEDHRGHVGWGHEEANRLWDALSRKADK